MNKYIVISVIGIAVVVALWWWPSTNTISTSKSLSEEIIVGTNAEFPPYTFKEENEIVGFDIDIAREVTKRLNKKMVLKDLTFDALIPEIQLGNIHIIAAGMTPTPEREKKVYFSKPYHQSNPLVIVALAKSPKITSVSDLFGKEVAVNEGYVADFYMSEQKNVEVRRLSTSLVSEGILAVKSGRAHAFVAAKSSLQPFLESAGASDLQVVIIKDTDEQDALAISKSYPELLTQIQTALDAMENDGTLDGLKKKWKLK